MSIEEKAWECTMDSSLTSDGVRIEGHPYVAELKLIDADHEREYEILRCKRCGNYSVAYQGALAPSNDSNFYQVVRVGGDQ